MDNYNESYWEDLPKDIVWIIINKLHTLEDILAFCGDPYLNERFCQDENGLLWEYLYHRDLSEEIELNEGETTKQKYLSWFKFVDYIENAEAPPQYDFRKKSNLLDSELDQSTPTSFQNFSNSNLSRIQRVKEYSKFRRTRKTFRRPKLDRQDVIYEIMRKASEMGFEKIIERMGLNTIPDKEITNLFYYAIWSGKLNMLKYLLMNNQNFIIEEENFYDLTRLGTSYGQYNILQYLIDEIAPIYNIIPDLEQILIGAINAKNGLPIIHLLLEKGVNIDDAIIQARSQELNDEVNKLENLKSELLDKNEL